MLNRAGALGGDRGGAGFSWLGLSAGVVVRDASRLALPKRQQGFRSPKSPWKRSASWVRALALALWRGEAGFLGWAAGRGSRLSEAFRGWAWALGWWCATPAELALPKRQQGFRSPKASWNRSASWVRALALALWRREACFRGWGP